jgi:peptide/nickel transport system substrate-binding protein
MLAGPRAAAAQGRSLMNMRWKLAALVVAFAAIGTTSRAETTLTAVMHSDLKIVDPIWTTAYITRNHGYMVYDTLFAMDEKGEIKPQMIENYDVSVDKLVYTLVLRDGLVWHDGALGLLIPRRKHCCGFSTSARRN